MPNSKIMPASFADLWGESASYSEKASALKRTFPPFFCMFCSAVQNELP